MRKGIRYLFVISGIGTLVLAFGSWNVTRDLSNIAAPIWLLVALKYFELSRLE